MAHKGVHHGDKVKLGGSARKKPKVNLSNTYGIKASSGGAGKSAVTQGRKGKPLTRKSGLGKIKGGK